MSAAQSNVRLLTPLSPDSIPVRITRFKSPSNTTTREESNTTWGGIVRGLENVHDYASKEACPMFVGAVFGDKRTAKNSLRHNANVLAVTAIVGDYDGEEVPPEEGQRRLQAEGVEAFIYTSGSHSPEKPRWRVMAPLERPARPVGAPWARLGLKRRPRRHPECGKLDTLPGVLLRPGGGCRLRDEARARAMSRSA